jgi:cobyric acid synthase CobQ
MVTSILRGQEPMAKPGSFRAFLAVGLREKMQEPPEPFLDLLSVHRGDVTCAPRLHATKPSAGPHLEIAHGGSPPREDVEFSSVIDASASISPLGPPGWLRQEIERSISQLGHYPERNSLSLRRLIAKHEACSEDQVVVGNGSSELLALLPLVADATRWIVAAPSYGEYRRSAAWCDKDVELFPLGVAPNFALDWSALAARLSSPSVVVLGHPNNPTGTLLDVEAFESLRRAHPATLFVVDEAYADFCSGFRSVWNPRARNLVVLRSLTKSWAIPGLRLGHALSSTVIARALQARQSPWSVSVLAQRVGARIFEDTEFLGRLREQLPPLKQQLLEGLARLPSCRVYDTAANWVLLQLTEPKLLARDVARAAQAHDVWLRSLDDFANLEGEWLRISLRNAPQTERLLDVLGHVLGHPRTRSKAKTPAAIMLQGTTSDAGKSLLVTALCRCLLEDGYRVAPFKAQNMSNNSGIAVDGGEMGRAQVVQAQACGLMPDTRMNPVLLKPTSDRGAQLVIRGFAEGHRDVMGYLATKRRCLEAALTAYDELGRDFDVIVCEGAGSAGEMNLRKNDIVNMGFVEHRNMPVLLVGDIDRGGAYASFVGHLEVLSEADRRFVRGFLINRFRGDERLLADAHTWVQRHTGRPVLGVIPYLKDLTLPDEDRLSLESGQRRFGDSSAPIHIAVIALPHVSNATDIDALTFERDVYLYLVERPEELGDPDVIVLLGTKNTMGDLAHLRRIGLDRALLDAHTRGAEVIGICGGLQMLGERIEDPNGIEGLEKSVRGLGLLPLCTEFHGPKTLRRCTGRHLPSRRTIHGYEIHHGLTDFAPVVPLFVAEDGTILGGGLPDRRVYGTYVHGLFDSDDFRHEFLDELRERKHLPRLGDARAAYSLEPMFVRLAEEFRKHVDYGAILRLMGLA